MCKYCDNNSDKLLSTDKVNLGIFGDYEITTNILNKGFIQTGISDGRGDLFYNNHKINFCPMCGRKLGE